MDVCPGFEQRLDDSQVIRLWLVDGGPNRAVQHRSSVGVEHFERSLVPDQNPNGLKLAAVCRPVEGVQSGIDPAGGIDIRREEMYDDARAAIETSTRECLRQRLRFTGEQALVKPL